MNNDTITFRSKIYDTITDAIGATPLVRLTKISAGLPGTLLGKLEAFNPAGSVKCRIGAAMLEAARREGKLKPDGVVIEPTSGNTGTGLTFASAAQRYEDAFDAAKRLGHEEGVLVGNLPVQRFGRHCRLPLKRRTPVK